MSIHCGFEVDRSADHGGETENRCTWGLLRHMVAKIEDSEELDLRKEDCGLHLPPLLKWINFPKLKTLALNGISEWKQGPIELEPEVHSCVGQHVHPLEAVWTIILP
jgi:hypothetical protein